MTWEQLGMFAAVVPITIGLVIAAIRLVVDESRDMKEAEHR